MQTIKRIRGHVINVYECLNKEIAMYIVKEIGLIVQYLASFDSFKEAKEFADKHPKPTKIYQLLYDGQVEHGPL